MKKIFLSLGLIALASLSVMASTATDHEDLKVNKEISTVEWIGKKVSGEHTGTVQIQAGNFHMHSGEISGGTVIIDMSTITCTDLSGGGKGKLEGHLNSPDFFDVSNHKTATLKIISTKKLDENTYTVYGSLTIKGITKPIKFPATIDLKESKMAAYAEMKIDRTLYGIKYGSGQFFEGLGNKMIDDEFVIKFKIAATK